MDTASAAPGPSTLFVASAAPGPSTLGVEKGSDEPSVVAVAHLTESSIQTNCYRRQGVLCDIVVEAGGSEFSAHRVILAASSDYFRVMFTSTFMEAQQCRVTLQDVEADIFEVILNFIYTGEVTVTGDNVSSLLQSGSLLQIQRIVRLCSDYLRERLNMENCLSVWQFGDLHTCTQLAHFAKIVAVRNFCELKDSSDLLQLPTDLFCQLIASDQLKVDSEVDVWHCCERWVSHDIELRRPLMSHLLSLIRLAHLPSTYFVKHVAEHALVKNAEDCKDILIDALKYHLKPSDYTVQLTDVNPRGMPISQRIILFGGQGPKALDSVEYFDAASEQLHKANFTLPLRRCRFCIAQLRDKIIFIGGFDGQCRLNTVQLFDPILQTFTELPSMSVCRSTHGVSVIDNRHVLAIGGFDGYIGLQCCEIFDGHSWSKVGDLSIRRSSVGTAVNRDHVYAVGGFCGSAPVCLNSVEWFDGAQNRWCEAPDMSQRRSGAAVTSFYDQLFVAGGCDNYLVRNSCEALDPREGHWRHCGNLNVARRNACLIAYHQQMFILGGDSSTGCIDSVEVYDARKDKWRLLEARLHEPRSYFGHALMDCVYPEVL